MSGWDAYVQNLTAGKAVEFAAIIGKDGNIWASNFGKTYPSLLINLGVAVLPTYQTAVPDPNDPEKTHQENYNEQTELLASNDLNIANLSQLLPTMVFHNTKLVSESITKNITPFNSTEKLVHGI